MTKTIQNWLDCGRETPFYTDTEMILQHVLNKTRTQLYLENTSLIKESENKKIKIMIDKVKSGVPLAYLLREISFFENSFHIEDGVFIPRSDTEILVENVFSKYSSCFNFLELGCGSGVVGLSLLLKWKEAHLTAVDLSEQAIKLTRKNAIRHSVENRVTLLQKDISVLDVQSLRFPISLVIANPPYIPYEDPMLDPNVHKTEPHLALYSGKNGFESIESWFNKVSSLFILNRRNGMTAPLHYFFEIGYNQSPLLKKKMSSYPHIKNFNFYKDLQGFDRVVHCQFE